MKFKVLLGKNGKITSKINVEGIPLSLIRYPRVRLFLAKSVFKDFDNNIIFGDCWVINEVTTGHRVARIARESETETIAEVTDMLVINGITVQDFVERGAVLEAQASCL